MIYIILLSEKEINNGMYSILCLKKMSVCAYVCMLPARQQYKIIIKHSDSENWGAINT